MPAQICSECLTRILEMQTYGLSKVLDGVVQLTRWFEKMESVFSISNCPATSQVKFATCTLQDDALTWWNAMLRPLLLKQLALMCPVDPRNKTHAYAELRQKGKEKYNFSKEQFKPTEKRCQNTARPIPQAIVTEIIRRSKPLWDCRIRPANNNNNRNNNNNNNRNNNNNNNRNNNNNNQQGNGLHRRVVVGNAGANPDKRSLRTFLLNHRYLISYSIRLAKYQAVIVCAEKIVRIPWRNKTLIIHGDGSNHGNMTRLNIISCTKPKVTWKKISYLFDTYHCKRGKDKSEKNDLRRHERVLAEQLKELSDKGLIRPIFITLGSSGLVCQKKGLSFPFKVGVYSQIEPKSGYHTTEGSRRRHSPELPSNPVDGHYEFSSYAVCFDKPPAYHDLIYPDIRYKFLEVTSERFWFTNFVGYSNAYHPQTDAKLERPFKSRGNAAGLTIDIFVVHLFVGLKLEKLKYLVQNKFKRPLRKSSRSSKGCKLLVIDRKLRLTLSVNQWNSTSLIKFRLKVSPWKGVVRFGKRGKVNPSMLDLSVLESRRGCLQARASPEELSRVHSTFHVSNLKKCHADEPLAVPLDGLNLDDKLHFY
ncbi:hypothetical protein Tco_0749145 [Tanacetum coccineum]|uniref:Reverse transcriptase domain-containing protein n=1 Tax=Tanacetum coccineum TaxID=301880 RepID=A0ABQ4YXR6_9ASTR